VPWRRQTFPDACGLTPPSHRGRSTSGSLPRNLHFPSHCCTPRAGRGLGPGSSKQTDVRLAWKKGQRFEKWGEKGGCPGESPAALVWLGGKSTAVRRQGGSRLLDTSRGEDEPAGTSRD